jgi:hypothetical protein
LEQKELAMAQHKQKERKQFRRLVEKKCKTHKEKHYRKVAKLGRLGSIRDLIPATHSTNGPFPLLRRYIVSKFGR